MLIEKYKLSKADRMALKLKKHENKTQDQPKNDPI